MAYQRTSSDRDIRGRGRRREVRRAAKARRQVARREALMGLAELG